MKMTLAKLKDVIPGDLRVGDVEYLSRNASRFISGQPEALAYWVTYDACGLCRNVWTIEMWAERYETISMDSFYVFLFDVVRALARKTSRQRRAIWKGKGRSATFCTFSWRKLQAAKSTTK